jgi:hypothetical protein
MVNDFLYGFERQGCSRDSRRDARAEPFGPLVVSGGKGIHDEPELRLSMIHQRFVTGKAPVYTGAFILADISLIDENTLPPALSQKESGRAASASGFNLSRTGQRKRD